jgi:putative membrane protein
MTHITKTIAATLSFGGALMLSTAAFAQSPMGQSAPGPTTASSAKSTEDYATKAAQDDLLEVQAGKLAAAQAQRDSVRKFADMMVKDHTQSTEQLKAALKAANVKVESPTSLDKERQAKLNQLKPLQGNQFDQVYMQQQVQAHQQALALHRSFAQKSDNGSLKAAAQKISDVVEHHLHAARELKDSIQAESAEGGDARTSR